MGVLVGRAMTTIEFLQQQVFRMDRNNNPPNHGAYVPVQIRESRSDNHGLQAADNNRDRPMSVKPDKFNDSTSWNDYLIHFEMCAMINCWTEAEMAAHLSVCLQGDAQAVHVDISYFERSDFPTLCNILNQRFGQDGQTELYKAQLKAKVKGPTEGYAELAHRVRLLVKQSYPQAPYGLIETLSKEDFIDALTDSDMRLRIQQSRPYTLNDAVQEAIEVDAFAKVEMQRMQYGKKKPVWAATVEQSTKRNEEEILSKILEN